jgi:hypothetical protein
MSGQGPSRSRAMAPGLLLAAVGIAWECYLRSISAWPTYLTWALIALGVLLTGCAAIAPGRWTLRGYWSIVLLAALVLVIVYWR